MVGSSEAMVCGERLLGKSSMGRTHLGRYCKMMADRGLGLKLGIAP